MRPMARPEVGLRLGSSFCGLGPFRVYFWLRVCGSSARRVSGFWVLELLTTGPGLEDRGLILSET